MILLTLSIIQSLMGRIFVKKVGQTQKFLHHIHNNDLDIYVKYRLEKAGGRRGNH